MSEPERTKTDSGTKSSPKSASPPSNGASESESPKTLDALPRPPVSPRNWDDLPGIRKRPSLAPPAPPPSEAPPPPTTHELFDVDKAEADYARDAVARRAAARANARPHPPKRSVTPEPPKASSDEFAQRLSTPLSWEAVKAPPAREAVKAGLADAVEEEVSDEFLEPLADSAPLQLPPIVSSEPLVSAVPMEAIVSQAPSRSSKRSGTVGVLALAAIGVLAVGWFVATQGGPNVASTATPVDKPNELPMPVAEPPSVPNPALRVPLPPLELDIGVPETSASPPVESAKPDPASVPPVAPSGVLPRRPPPVEGPPFDSEAAAASLNQVAGAASACRNEGDPAGSATVLVRFAPSGRATSAVVESGPFAGTVTGGCIATTFRKARVPAFSGDYVTVKKTITLR
ncbi:MAG TPA: hypothetical protein VMS65_08970 [Polyangiaceae bacterium]|nr:hypothetical protein [Polyangiaceae bacterium]